MVMSKGALVSAALLLGQASAALPPIVMKGTKFFFENGTQFFMKGVAYQQAVGAAGAKTTSEVYIDPLADATACARDIPILAAAGTNTIRVYQIDPTADHTQCMKLLDANGIYVIADLSEPANSIQQDNTQWTVPLFDRYKKVVDSMSSFSNVIGFFSGNEVTNNKTNTPASAFVKAATRDTKKYISSKGGRWMGVGYATNDDAEIRVDMAHYFNCGNQSDAIDYWGYNIYSWCGDSTFERSGYKSQVDFFKNYSVPVFFAEYGCNTGAEKAESRDWQDAKALYSNDMTGVFSGGVVYMYFEEDNHYGLVKVDSSGKATTMKNYNALKTVIASVRPSATAMSAYNPTNSPQPCPARSDVWRVNPDVLPPTPDKSVCDCMVKAATCKPVDNLAVKSYGELFGYVCGLPGNLCAGINGNATAGVYGAYSMCDDLSKLTYVMDNYYKTQNSASGACDHGGKGQIVAASAAASSCTAVLSSASAANSHATTATGAAAGPASSSSVAVPFAIKGAFTLGEVAVGLYVLVAMGIGAGMVLL